MAAWRDSAGSRDSSGKVPAWRLSSGATGQTPPVRPGRRGKWLRIGLSGTGALGALFLLFMLTDFSCEQARIYVTSAGSGAGQYSHPAFPEIIFGEEDAQSFLTLGKTSRYLDVVQTPREINFETVYKGSPDSDSDCLVIYLNLHGTADSEGAFLFPDSFDPDDSTTGSTIRARTFWNAIADQPQAQKKLVLLDVTRLPFEDRLGFFENRFYRELSDTISRIPKLSVICACSAGETNWTSPRLGPGGNGGSVFAHYVSLGLEGEADTIKRNGRVTVRELYEYVHRNVNAWVQQNRDPAGQHPQLFHGLDDSLSDHDFTIAAVSRSLRATDPDDATDTDTTGSESEVKAGLKRCWTELDRLQTEVLSARYHLQPVRWRLALVRLMEAEQWLARDRPKRAASLVKAVESDIEEMTRHGTIAGLVRQTNDSFVQANLLTHLPGPLETQPRIESSVRLLPEHVTELVASADISAGAAPGPNDVLSLFEQLEAAGHPAPGALPLISRDLTRAAGLRRIAFDRLVLSDMAGVTTAVREASAACRSMNDISAGWQTAEQTLNRVHAAVPELLRWSAARHTDSTVRGQLVEVVVNALDRDPPIPVDINDLADLIPPEDVSRQNNYDGLEVEIMIVCQLGLGLQSDLFDIVTAGSLDDPQTLVSQASEINRRLDEIRRRFEDLAGSYLKSQQYHADDWRELRDLLRVPVLSPDRRMTILDEQRNVASRLYEAELEESDSLEAAVPRRPVDSLWPALCAVRCLTLGEDNRSTIEDLEGAWLSAWRDTTRDETDSILKLGIEVRRAWEAKRLLARPPQFGVQPRLPEIRKALFQADQASRTLHPADAIEAVTEGNPAEQLRRFYLAEQCLEDTQRYQEDFWAGWYETAATSSLTSAKTLFPRIPKSRTAPLQERLKELLTATAEPQLETVEFGSSDRTEVTATILSTAALPSGESRLRMIAGDASSGIDSVKPFYTIALGPRLKTQTLKVRFQRARNFAGTVCELSGTAKVFYRGHTWSGRRSEFPVLPCPPKGIPIRYSPAPETGAVRVSGSDQRPILFILDASGSMTPPKMAQAKVALSRVLAKFAAANEVTPRKRKAAFFAFGHKKGPLNDSNQVTYLPERLPTWPRGEQKPDVESIDAQLIKRLESLLADETKFKPQGNTPLLNTILMVCDHMLTKKLSGIIVTISDGADSYKDPQQLRDIDAIRRLAARSDVDIELHVVGFAVVDEQGVLTEDGRLLESLIQFPRDRFHNAPDAQELSNRLTRATDPRPFLVDPVGRGADRSKPLGEIVDRLAKGRYDIRFGAVRPVSIDIRGGERLSYQLREDGLAWDTLRSRALGEETADSGQKLAVTGFTRNPRTNQSSFTVCLLPPDSSTRFMPRPDEMEIQIRALEELSKPRSYTWQVLPGQSVPSWEITVDDWPGRSGARVTAYWKTERTQARRLKLQDVQSQTVDLGSIAGQSRVLRFEKLKLVPGVPGGRSGGTIELTCRVEPALAGPFDETVFDHLAGLRLELLGQGRGAAVDVSLRREIIETEGRIHATFTLPQGGAPDQYDLGVTPWFRRRQAAHSLIRSIELSEPQD